MKKFFEEYGEFLAQGNIVDMAVGVIIGAAFGKIVTALVDNILMPLIGMILGGIDFTGLSVTVGSAVLQYGAFIQAVIDFLIIAFCIFLFVKAIAKVTEKFQKKKEEEAAEEPSEEVKLLTQIRDELAKKN